MIKIINSKDEYLDYKLNDIIIVHNNELNQYDEFKLENPGEDNLNTVNHFFQLCFDKSSVLPTVGAKDPNGGFCMMYHDMKRILCSKRSSAIGTKAMNTIYRNSENYHITANTFKSPFCRRQHNLFSLQNIVIDIDCHMSEVLPQERDLLISDLEYTIKMNLADFDELMPPPNVLVNTGRGLQIWWTFVPVPISAKFVYVNVREYIIKVLKEFIDEFSGEFNDFAAYFSIDGVASRNLNGMFRLPGNVNTATGCQSYIEIFSEEVHNFFEISKQVGNVLTPKKKKKSKRRNAVGFQKPHKSNVNGNRLISYDALFPLRVNALFHLAKLRKYDVTGSRDIFVYLVFNDAQKFLSTAEAKSKAHELNQMFVQPLREQEFENAIMSVFATHSKDGMRGYAMKNKTIIDMLNITPAEQDTIGLHPAKHSNAARDAKRKKKKRRKENKVIKALLRGETLKKAAAIAGVCKKTVQSIVKRHNMQEKLAWLRQFRKKAMKIVKAHKNHQSREEKSLMNSSICAQENTKTDNVNPSNATGLIDQLNKLFRSYGDMTIKILNDAQILTAVEEFSNLLLSGHQPSQPIKNDHTSEAAA